MVKTALGVALSVVVLISLGQFIFNAIYKFPQKIHYGVTFSPKYAQDLKLDWKLTFIKLLDELKVRSIRIPSYWDVLEASELKDDFSETDFMVDEASKREANIILVLGARQPRWPECHIPSWAVKLTVSDRRQKLLQFIEKVVKRYNDHPAIWAYQVENEPLLDAFGEGCDPSDESFLAKEVEKVRTLSNKQIIVTDSGELGFWITPMKLSDIFGTTLYREVYNPLMGYVTYPILPYLYNIKSQIVRYIFAPKNQKTIILELQAEPWSTDNNLSGMAIDRQLKLFSVDDFRDYIKYAKGTGFDEDYLWGVEWWFWVDKNGHPEYLEYAKSLFR